MAVALFEVMLMKLPPAMPVEASLTRLPDQLPDVAKSIRLPDDKPLAVARMTLAVESELAVMLTASVRFWVLTMLKVPRGEAVPMPIFDPSSKICELPSVVAAVNFET